MTPKEEMLRRLIYTCGGAQAEKIIREQVTGPLKGMFGINDALGAKIDVVIARGIKKQAEQRIQRIMAEFTDDEIDKLYRFYCVDDVGVHWQRFMAKEPEVTLESSLVDELAEELSKMMREDLGQC